MTTKHLTDDEVQQWVLDGVSVSKETVAHIHSCEECRGRAETYRLLITGIEQQPAAAFDFNLQELVISRLPSPAPKVSHDKSLAWIFILPGIFFTGMVIYLFRDGLASLFAGIASLFVYLTIITAAIVTVALCIDIYRTYRNKMNSLDLY